MSRPTSTESTFRAVAHATRRGVIDLLLRREHSAGELAEHFKHSRPVLSRHLRVLEGVGLVAFQRRGNRLVYTVNPGAFDVLHQWVGRLPRGSGTR